MNTKHDELSLAQVARAEMPAPGEEPHFLPHPVMDRLLEAVIVLGGELWIERDRRRALESLLHSRGVVTSEEIETHCESDAQGRQEELSALVTRLLDPLRNMHADN